MEQTSLKCGFNLEKKVKKILSSMLIAAALVATAAEAGSIGRSSGGGRSSGSFSSFSSPSRSAAKPTGSYSSASPNKTGGIGGTNGSIGVRKSEVTGSVRQDIAASRPSTPSSSPSYGGTSGYSPHYAPTPAYGHVTTPQPSVTNGSTFVSSLGGSFLGSAIGNMLFSNHGTSGTTVINNGTGTTAPTVQSSGSYVGPMQGIASVDGSSVITTAPLKHPYTVWSFIGDVIGFMVLAIILTGLAWLIYRGYQMVRNYINRERGVSTVPFNATERFWEIQNAFAAADIPLLNRLLGPDTVHELTRDLAPSKVTVHNVSHEIRLQNPTEFSVWYKFEDDGEDVDQVWHYERFGAEWKLNGIENV